MIMKITITQAGDPPDDKEFLVDVDYGTLVGYSKVVEKTLLLRELSNIIDSKLELE